MPTRSGKEYQPSSQSIQPAMEPNKLAWMIQNLQARLDSIDQKIQGQVAATQTLNQWIADFEVHEREDRESNADGGEDRNEGKRREAHPLQAWDLTYL